MITNISIASVFVKDIDESKAFYIDVLGFQEHTDITLGDGYRWCTVKHPSQPELQVGLTRSEITRLRREIITLTRDLDLPRGTSRERVRVNDREYRLSGDDVRVLATVGAFRVVPAGDLREPSPRTPTRPARDLERLRDLGR